MSMRYQAKQARSVAGAEAGQDETGVKGIDEAVAVLISRIAARIAGAHRAAETGQHESRIERIHEAVAVGIAFTVARVGRHGE